ncbi:hypothetical protein DACRYDRAFT_24784 [Dacryopinax primogenitus]|uniref:Uncharacterized protein n=1 Tax=Dacryopinax primogenitus (strain DJM 731) TaxID=1858805 RepID=M5FNR1_DACPD|nr:uncharacterized protein DACRYDRAFT_24784 [Dacryopinax primogenitus]EJT97825.1 hypothetical protein DACRYDRAFT_24784 [Dacryopinax primogenitus]
MTDSHPSPALLLQVAYAKQKGLGFGAMVLSWLQQHPELVANGVARGTHAHVDALGHCTCNTLTPDTGVPIQSTSYTQDIMEPVSIPATVTVALQAPADHADRGHRTCITEESKTSPRLWGSTGACLRGPVSNSLSADSASNSSVVPSPFPQTTISHSDHTAAAVPGSVVVTASTECPAHVPSTGTVKHELDKASADELSPAYHPSSYPSISSSLLDAHPASNDEAVPLYCHHEVLPPRYTPPRKRLKLPPNLSRSSSPTPSTSSSSPPSPRLVALDRATLQAVAEAQAAREVSAELVRRNRLVGGRLVHA